MAAVSPSVVSVDLNENCHIAESVNGFDRDLVENNEEKMLKYDDLKDGEDNVNSIVVTPASSTKNDIENSTCELFERFNTGASSPTLSPYQPVRTLEDSTLQDELNEGEHLKSTVENSELSNFPAKAGKKGTAVNKKPRAPRPRKKPASNAVLKDNEVEGIAILVESSLEDNSNEKMSENHPEIIEIVGEQGAATGETTGEVEFSTTPELKGDDLPLRKRKSKKPNMYADSDYVKPKKVRKKNPVPSITPAAAPSSVYDIKAFTTECHMADESAAAATIVPFSNGISNSEAAPNAAVAPSPPCLPPPPVKVLPEYSPEIADKIQQYKEKSLSLCNELIALEMCSDLHDNMINVEGAIEALIEFCKSVKSEVSEAADAAMPNLELMVIETVEGDKETEKDANDEKLTVTEAAVAPPVKALIPAVVIDVNNVAWKCKSIISRCLQGSASTLPQIIPALKSTLTSTLERVESALTGDCSNKQPQTLFEEAKHFLSQLLASEEKIQSCIQEIAVRESYGSRQRFGPAALPVNVDEDPIAIYRWEVHSVLYLSATGQAATRELRAVRGRYGRAVKASQRVIEQLQAMRGPATETEVNKSKVTALEDRLAKCIAEVEKAKGRRQELLKKRAADAEEKARKEELKEAKRREREEKLSAAAAAALLREKEKEKEKKKSSAPEKEKKPTISAPPKPFKSIMTFYSVSKDKSAGSAGLNVDASLQSSSTASNSVATDATVTESMPSANVSLTVDLAAEEEKREQRRMEFNKSIEGKLDMLEIVRRNKLWMEEVSKQQKAYQKEWRVKQQKRLRRRITITVSLSALTSNDFGDDDNNYCEIRDVVVDNKIRTLSFCEDHRPAYVGTWSKRSQYITGRRPFGRDDEQLNYEYDSEAEWEEEEGEGEDIMESDEEDKREDAGGGAEDELEYDDMFCRDHDFGSDLDSDGEELTAAVKNVVGTGYRTGEEICGPKFLRFNPLNDSGEIQVFIRAPPTVSLLDFAEEEGDGALNTATGVMVGSYKEALRDSEATKLTKFTAVIFTTSEGMPFLGEHKKNHIAKSANKPKKKKKEGDEADNESPSGGKISNGKLCGSELAAFLQFVHGKKDGLKKIVNSFCEQHPTLVKVRVKETLLECAKRQKKVDGSGSERWIVSPEFVAASGVEGLSLPNLESSPLRKKRKISECIGEQKSTVKTHTFANEKPKTECGRVDEDVGENTPKHGDQDSVALLPLLDEPALKENVKIMDISIAPPSSSSSSSASSALSTAVINSSHGSATAARVEPRAVSGSKQNQPAKTAEKKRAAHKSLAFSSPASTTIRKITEFVSKQATNGSDSNPNPVQPLIVDLICDEGDDTS